MFSAASLVIIVNVATALLKKFVMPKYGRVGVQVLVFALALAGAIYMNYGAAYKVYVTDAAIVFSLAVALYEIILSRLSFFKGSSVK